MAKKYIVITAIAALFLGGMWLVVSGNKSVESFLADKGLPVNGFDAKENISGLPEAKPFDIEPTILKDGDVFDMVIAPVKKNIDGRWVRMLAYNGSVPGPVLRIPQQATITIRLTNDGDTSTTLHSHGVRMDNAFDGVPDVTQKAVQPGETFEYKLKFSDAGAFWYHPHVRTDYAIESGLYGSYIVTPTDTAYWQPVNREVPIILDDIALDKNGLLPFSKDTTDHVLMGRFGNTMLVNGETDSRLDAKQGEVIRFYLTNAANTRVFNVVVPGARVKLVGADLGRYAHESFVDEMLIAPGERRIVDVMFEKSGSYRLMHETPGKDYGLKTIAVSDEAVGTSYAREFSVLRNDDAVIGETSALINSYLEKTPDKKLNLELAMNGAVPETMGAGSGHMGGGHMMSDGSMMAAEGMGMGDDGSAIEWEDTMSMMNRRSDSNMMTWELVDGTTGKSNMDVNGWEFKVGDNVKIRIFNDPKSAHPMQHPIHFHGQRFLVLSTNGVKNENLVWQDTALVLKGDTVDILLEASNPGVWMAHCHILEHAESGMMIPFTVK